jgi:hypothetical protein
MEQWFFGYLLSGSCMAQHRHNKKNIGLIGIGVFFITGVFVLQSMGYHPSDILGRSTALRLRHAKFSLQKVTDIVFAPYFFRSTDLPVYELSIDSNGFRALNAPLSDWDPDSLIPLPGDKKVWTKGVFSSGEFSEEVDVRYRGDSQIHWAHNKKSFLVEFPDDAFFNGMRRMHLAVPESQYYYVGALNDRRAEKLGVLHSSMSFVRLRLNGQDRGVYLMSEDMGEEWVEKRGLIGSVLSFDSDAADTKQSVFSEDNLAFWETSSVADQYSLDSVYALRELVINADDDAFRAVAPIFFDLDSFYAWDIMTVLSQSREQNDLPPSNNFRLFFDRTTGKLSPVSYNIRIREEDDLDFYADVPMITARILSIPEFKKERDDALYEYIQNETEDDIRFFEETYQRTRKEFFGDTVKFNSNFAYLAWVRKFRAYVAENFGRAEQEFAHSYGYDGGSVSKFGLNFRGQFRGLIDAGLSRGEFISRHPEFIAFGADSVRLFPGAYLFRETVIIPHGVKLIIDPGASLYFGEAASLVSYGSVRAEGTAQNPIIFTAAENKKSWGSFLVVSAKHDTSVLRYTTFSGGGAFKEVNGISATGMVAFHGSDVLVENSSFIDSRGEDALNIKYASVAVRGNSFLKTVSDAFDCDVCSGVIENNTFRSIGTGINQHSGFGNIGGDGIDISFSDILIRSNTIIGATDKGISVGEASHPEIEKNTIAGCAIAVAVKDSSHASMRENILLGNKRGIEIYQKKEIFGPASAVIFDSLLWSNGVDVNVLPDGSSVEYGSDNIIESQGGIRPDFSSFLTSEFVPFLE